MKTFCGIAFNPYDVPSEIQHHDQNFLILRVKVFDTIFTTAFYQIAKIYLSINAVLRVLSSATKESDADSSWDFPAVGLEAFAEGFTCIWMHLDSV